MLSTTRCTAVIAFVRGRPASCASSRSTRPARSRPAGTRPGRCRAVARNGVFGQRLRAQPLERAALRGCRRTRGTWTTAASCAVSRRNPFVELRGRTHGEVRHHDHRVARACRLLASQVDDAEHAVGELPVGRRRGRGAPTRRSRRVSRFAYRSPKAAGKPGQLVDLATQVGSVSMRTSRPSHARWCRPRRRRRRARLPAAFTPAIARLLTSRARSSLAPTTGVALRSDVPRGEHAFVLEARLRGREGVVREAQAAVLPLTVEVVESVRDAKAREARGSRTAGR